MTIAQCVDFLNFWIRKERGAFYTIDELMLLMDRGQMAYYNDIVPKYATSQIIKDCLSPFRVKVSFDHNSTNDGLIGLGGNFQDLLDITIQFDENGRTIYYPVKMTNEDEIGDRLNSQIDPPTIQAPVGEVVGLGQFQFYPAVDEYTGTVRYLRRPNPPTCTYDVIGGRVIEITGGDPLEWRDIDIDAILLKSLSSIGINLSDQEVSQFAEMKSQENYQGVNHL